MQGLLFTCFNMTLSWKEQQPECDHMKHEAFAEVGPIDTSFYFKAFKFV